MDSGAAEIRDLQGVVAALSLMGLSQWASENQKRGIFFPFGSIGNCVQTQAYLAAKNYQMWSIFPSLFSRPLLLEVWSLAQGWHHL